MTDLRATPNSPDQQSHSRLFSEVKIGPLILPNRAIRAAAFESMCEGNRPTQELQEYHLAVARGGIGMTTIAYASVTRNGLSFEKQLWMRDEVVDELRELTDKIHATGAKASIQLGHCGNMSHKTIAGERPISASSGFNLYSPTLVRAMTKDEIKSMARSFGEAVRLARRAGFDAVEIHAGHGYLISQFLSPYTNKRRDEYGGSLDNRMRFMKEVMAEVINAAQGDIAVLVKINMRDGFKGGMETDETLLVAQELEQLGAHALVLSGGFVSRAPMYVMHGAMPIKTMAHYMKNWWLKWGVLLGGKMLMKTEPFKEAYFLEDAMKFRQALKIPLVYVGGLVTRAKIEEVLGLGFECVAMARSLVCMPDFVNRMIDGLDNCGCGHSNYCIARMYSENMKCHKCVDKLPKSVQREIRNLENK